MMEACNLQGRGGVVGGVEDDEVAWYLLGLMIKTN